MAISRSSRSSESPARLGAVYERRRQRTVRLVELSIAALLRAGERPSLAAIARISRTIDPMDPRGISESAILHNVEAYALYQQHADRKRHASKTPKRRSPPGRTAGFSHDRVRVSAARNLGRVRQRYIRASKANLVERLLACEQAYAEMEERWLRTADDLLIWIMLLDSIWRPPVDHRQARSPSGRSHLPPPPGQGQSPRPTKMARKIVTRLRALL